MILTHSGGFHPRCGVDRVVKEAIAGHLESDHSGANGSGMNADAQHQRLVRPVPDVELDHGPQ